MDAEQAGRFLEAAEMDYTMAMESYIREQRITNKDTVERRKTRADVLEAATVLRIARQEHQISTGTPTTPWGKGGRLQHTQAGGQNG